MPTLVLLPFPLLILLDLLPLSFLNPDSDSPSSPGPIDPLIGPILLFLLFAFGIFRVGRNLAGSQIWNLNLAAPSCSIDTYSSGNPDPLPHAVDTWISTALHCHAPSAPPPTTSVLSAVMLCSTYTPLSSSFLLSFLHTFLPLSSKATHCESLSVPSPMDLDPPDPSHAATPTIPPSAPPTLSAMTQPAHVPSSTSHQIIPTTSATPCRNLNPQNNAPASQAIITPPPQMDPSLMQALEALQVSTRDTPAGTSREQEEALETDFNMLIKIKENQGSPRPLTIHQVSRDLRQTWGERYAAVSAIAANSGLFLATFHNGPDMMHIVRRQPWTVQRQNILLELHTPNRDLNSYTFQYLYANVRVYGLAFEFRTPQIINAILHRIGLPSDLDEQLELHIQRDECYAQVRAKLRVHLPAVDRMTVQVTPTMERTVYFHYERISRICTFCGYYFHNNTDCPPRIARIMNGENVVDPLGRWMTRLSYMPWNDIYRQVRVIIPRLI